MVIKHQQWLEEFNERERGLIWNCINYATQNPSGLPGHNLMLIISKMAEMLSDIEPVSFNIEVPDEQPFQNSGPGPWEIYKELVKEGKTPAYYTVTDYGYVVGGKRFPASHPPRIIIDRDRFQAWLSGDSMMFSVKSFDVDNPISAYLKGLERVGADISSFGNTAIINGNVYTIQSWVSIFLSEVRSRVRDADFITSSVCRDILRGIPDE